MNTQLQSVPIPSEQEIENSKNNFKELPLSTNEMEFESIAEQTLESNKLTIAQAPDTKKKRISIQSGWQEASAHSPFRGGGGGSGFQSQQEKENALLELAHPPQVFHFVGNDKEGDTINHEEIKKNRRKSEQRVNIEIIEEEVVKHEGDVTEEIDDQEQKGKEEYYMKKESIDGIKEYEDIKEGKDITSSNLKDQLIIIPYNSDEEEEEKEYQVKGSHKKYISHPKIDRFQQNMEIKLLQKMEREEQNQQKAENSIKKFEITPKRGIHQEILNKKEVDFDNQPSGQVMTLGLNGQSISADLKYLNHHDQTMENQNGSFNWNISPDSKHNRQSNQHMLHVKDRSDNETDYEPFQESSKDPNALILFDEGFSRQSSLPNSNKKDGQRTEYQGLEGKDINLKLQQDQSFDHTLRDQQEHGDIDSSHNLKEFQTNDLRISSNRIKGKDMTLNQELIDVKLSDEPGRFELSKHIGKDLIPNGLGNSQGTQKLSGSERTNTKSSFQSQSKMSSQINRLELEKKKERQIQKFCMKFFKDKLDNRSGVPTLTQKLRTMNLESDTPNPEFKSAHQSVKEGLLNEELRRELFNIEEHQKYRLVMDSFLKKFSQNPKEAISFLIEKQLCDDTEEDIAYLLLTTEGLNKEQLGVFFGSNKDRNQQILEAFCALMDFRNLRFDQAIRLFLSRFRLPGEAQQIDRIVQKFTNVYCNDNPQVFSDEDTPYILCYAAIMLNVDAHSEKIEKKNKMQKQQFVNINLSCTRNAVTREFLEMLYDNIVKEKFETKVDDIEKIYSRVPIESMSKQFDNQNRMLVVKALQAGSIFLKYGRQGKPHTRKFYLSEGLDKIIWRDIERPKNMQPPKSYQTSGSPPAEKKFSERYILVKDITDLALGSNTTEVMRRNNIPPEFDQLCFSIITPTRTLDFKCNDMETKFKWIAFVYNHLNDQRLARKNKIMSNSQKNLDLQRITEIWRIDVFSKWDDHWDYSSSRPKNLQNYEISQTKSTFLSSICSCFASHNKMNSSKRINNTISLANSCQMQSPLKRDYEELELTNQNNKSLLLISLWKIGMPSWVRKTIWPLTIGNRLEITENLYKILLKQVAASQSSQGFADNLIVASINKMKTDLKRLQTKTLHSSLPEGGKEKVENVLSAFIFYRPDIGYINEAMPNLAAVLIHFIDDEYTVFKCFINLLHSYHFLSFFRGEMSEIKWRVEFFNEHLEKRMPLLLLHFKALDISSELFLMHWFLNLFSNVFDLETVFRIWDNFLLEGEVFAFKAGIAFIEYFNLEFKMATFDDAISLLKNPPEDIFCSDLYFNIIEDIKIPFKEFNQVLDKQNVAKLAPQILEQLL